MLDGPRATLTPADAARGAWDAVVIGSGPAGCAAAYALAKAGAAVLLLDRGRFPRPKVCGCCLSAAGVAAMKSMGVSVAGVPLRTLVVSVPARTIEIGLAGGIAVSRLVLDPALVRHAITGGAQFLDGACAAVHPRTPDAAVTIRHEGASFTLEARTVVVADGLHGGALAQRSEFQPRVRASGRIGVGATLPHDALPLADGIVRMCIGAGAYVGLVRLADGSIDLAASVDPIAARAAGGPGPLVHTILASCGVDAALDHVRLSGTPILTRQRLAAKGRVFVAGDAAAYAEPLSGEGMTWALRAGAAVAAHALAAVRGDAHAGDRWCDHFAREWRGRQTRSRLLAGAAARPCAAKLAAWTAAAAPRVAAAMAHLFFGAGAPNRPSPVPT